jgi:DNA ligase-1
LAHTPKKVTKTKRKGAILMAKRTGIMLFYPFEEKRLLKWSPPYIIQPKLDGERCRAVYDEEFGWSLISSELNTIISVPHLNQSLTFSNIPPSVELDGELYVHGLSFEEIHSMVSRRVNIHPNHHNMIYHVFDIVDTNLPQWERLRILRRLSERFHPGIEAIKCYLAEDLDGVLKAYDRILGQGYEGIIVRQLDAPYIRRRSIYGMKFKPKKDDYYKIVGYKQMVDKDGSLKPMLGALICQANDGEDTFSVGSGMSDDFRCKYWPAESAEPLVGSMLHVEYQHTTPGKGVPRFPVFKEIIFDEGDNVVISPFL